MIGTSIGCRGAGGGSRLKAVVGGTPPVLALLDHHKPRSQLADAVPGKHQVSLAGKQNRLAVVEHQSVDLPKQLQQPFPLSVDPKIHRVGHR